MVPGYVAEPRLLPAHGSRRRSIENSEGSPPTSVSEPSRRVPVEGGVLDTLCHHHAGGLLQASRGGVGWGLGAAVRAGRAPAARSRPSARGIRRAPDPGAQRRTGGTNGRPGSSRTAPRMRRPRPRRPRRARAGASRIAGCRRRSARRVSWMSSSQSACSPAPRICASSRSSGSFARPGSRARDRARRALRNRSSRRRPSAAGAARRARGSSRRARSRSRSRQRAAPDMPPGSARPSGWSTRSPSTRPSRTHRTISA